MALISFDGKIGDCHIFFICSDLHLNLGSFCKNIFFNQGILTQRDASQAQRRGGGFQI